MSTDPAALGAGGTGEQGATPRPPRLLGSRGERRLLWLGVGLGIVYGVLCRALFGNHVASGSALERAFAPMTLGFLFLVPFALGFLVVWIGSRDAAWPWWSWIVVPWLPAFAALGAALALAWEGIICIALWLPLVMIMSSLGGVAAGVWRRVRRRRAPTGALLGALLLPIFVAPLESRIGLPHEIRVVPTAIEIAADPDVVWRNIVEVPTIAPAEQRRRLVHLIGFPRPLAARTSGRGVGAVRHATFEGGVLFLETVTRYEPDHALAFRIQADADTIPQQTLDEHVTVGGPYFDVLEGSYEIEPLTPGRVRLHLASRHRLSTHFNLYAGWWTDFILRDVQENILDVIRARCEAEARRPPIAVPPASPTRSPAPAAPTGGR